MASKKETMDLSSMFEKLEKVISNLEGDNVSLEESFKLYSEGIETVKECSKTIDEIEKKVMILDANGEPKEFQ